MTRSVSDGARNRSLDVLRGVAVLMVLATHAFSGSADGSASRGRMLLARFAGLGSYGVDLFFVLSGLLISGLLFSELAKTGSLRLPRFWLRRGLKIWPSYYAAYGTMLAALCFRDLRAHRTTEAAAQLWHAIPNVVFAQNYWHYDWRWLASWSLAVEEHFYLGLPIALSLIYLVARRPRVVPGLCVAVIVICPLLRVREVLAAPALVSSTVISIQTHFRIDALCCGVLLGYFHATAPSRLSVAARHWRVAVVFAIAALAIPFAWPWGSPITETIGLSAIALAFSSLVAVAVVLPDWGSSFVPRWLARAGVYSYTIYLAQAIARATPLSSGVAFIVLSIGLGVILSHAVERPFLAWRERLLPRPARSRAREEIARAS